MADDNFTDMSIDELTQVKVYSASKKNEEQLSSPAAIYVITRQDIKQMGVTNIADALRTVPGLHVAKLSSNKWMVASRGFGEQFSNKLLVLIDGRPIYSTLYSGVTWDQHDLLLDNIKQIEVIRGPGATIWGANAVNGVINIITRSSEETVGNYLNVIVGNNPQGVVEGRVGRQLSDHSHFRSSLKFKAVNDNEGINRPSYQDAWHSESFDFRYDNQKDYENSLSLTGNIYAGHEDQLYRTPTLSAPFSLTSEATEIFKGFYLNGKYQKGLRKNGDLNISGYVDYNHWDYVRAAFDTKTISTDIQHDIALDNRNTISWGGGQKIVRTEIDSTDWFNYTPPNRTRYYSNLFLQDQIALVPKTLFLTLGTKLESSSFISFTHQPSAKLAWKATGSSLVWGSVSRALRTPSIGTQDLSLQVSGAPGGYTALIGNNTFKPEELIAYEFGYKSTPMTGLQFDLASYYNTYNNLRTFEIGTPYGNIATPLNIANYGHAETHGVEVSTKYRFSPLFWVSADYAYSSLNLDLKNNAVDSTFLLNKGKWPQQTFSLRSSYQLAENLNWNNSFYYVDSLPAISIKHHSTVDTNLTYAITDTTEIAVSANNLFGSAYQEYSAPLFSYPSKIGQSYYVRITSSF